MREGKLVLDGVSGSMIAVRSGEILIGPLIFPEQRAGELQLAARRGDQRIAGMPLHRGHDGGLDGFEPISRDSSCAVAGASSGRSLCPSG